MGLALCENIYLRTFNFRRKAIKDVFILSVKYITFTIHFQDIYIFIKGHLAQNQERSCKVDLSIPFMVLNGSPFEPLSSLEVYFCVVLLLSHLQHFR